MTKRYSPYKKTTTTKTATKTNTTTSVAKKQKTAEELKRELELQEIVAAQLTDRRFAPVAYDNLDKRVTYVTAKNGLFKVTKTPIGLFKELMQKFDIEIVGIPPMEEGVDLAIPKIPFKYILEALSFYRDVNTKDKTEASTLYFWNHNNIVLPEIPGLREEGQLVIYCPVQINSGALSEFGDDENVSWMRENLALLLELHSHNTMNSFFSGTDDANENNTQFYGVWGKVDKEEPAFSFRYVVGDTKKEVEPTMLIDWPTIHRVKKTIVTETFTFKGDTELIDLEIERDQYTSGQTPVEEITEELVKGPFKQIDYPEDWMGQHSIRTYKYKRGSTYPKATGPSYGSEHYGAGWDDYYGHSDMYGGYYGNSSYQQGSLLPDNEVYTNLPIDMYYLDYLEKDEINSTDELFDFEPNEYFRLYMEDFILSLMDSPEGLKDFY